MATSIATNEVIHKPRPASSKLEDQAATAALYVTRNKRQSKTTGQEFLDKDQRLSSAGAAASLKYANPQDLPSYPSAGLKSNNSAAGAAASLGWANQKSFEHWKPDPSASASTAAALANDYKMAPLWQPEQSTNGAKAAVLAARDGGKVEIWQPEANSPWGNSAAAKAFKKFGAGGLSPVLDYGYTTLGRQGSMQAATGAMAQGRRRAQSDLPAPIRGPTYPDEANASSNALSAATSAHKQGRLMEEPVGGSTPYTNMGREMYTSHPPVAPEVEERNRQDTIHASAVAMAKGMYSRQQTQLAVDSHAQSGAAAAHGRHPSISSTISDETPPMRFNNLQEAAQKLAQERLAKLHDEHSKNREYRDYYGGNNSSKGAYVGSSIAPVSHKLSMRGRARRRASSDGDLDEDREQSNKIRGQMSIFSNNLAQIDERKRAKDRENLIAVAQRNVTKSLHGMDERVFAETGKVAPSLLSEWEVKAHAAAQAKSDARMENHGMIHIGGGKFIKQSEIDAVAQRNVQPVLDEINEKAEAERERQAALKLEQETTARKAAEKKTREKESKAINKKLKQQDKDEEKMRKADEKSARKEEERLAKEKRKSAKSGGAVIAPTAERTVDPASESVAATEPLTAPTESAVEPVTPETSVEPATAIVASPLEAPEVETPAVEASAVEEPSEEPPEEPPVESVPQTSQPPEPAAIRTSMEDGASLRMREVADAANPTESTPLSPSSPSKGKMKNWLKSKFSSKSNSNKMRKSPTAEKQSKEEKFVGGAALTGASVKNDSNASLGQHSSSIRDVALATAPSATSNTNPGEIPVSEYLSEDIDTTEPAGEEERVAHPARRASEVSSLSSVGGDETADDTADEEFLEARDNFDEDLAPPPTFVAEKRSSENVRDSKFIEAI